MGVTDFSDRITSTKYCLHRKAGRSIIDRRPVFSPDGESLAIIVENTVRVYNIQTGDCVRTLETESSIKEIVDVHFPDNEDYNLYGCSDSGCIITWTWENGAVLREINLKIPDKLKVITFNIQDNSECFITGICGTKKNLHLGTYSMKTGDLLHEYTQTIVKFYEIIRVSLGWCRGQQFAAITNGSKFLIIQNLKQPNVSTLIANHNKIRVLSVAAHHKENAVAITDAIGRVTVFRGNLFDEANLAREVMHWHYLPPFAVCFSLQGSYLYSGGMEQVLIKWTVGNLSHKASEKDMIPRLPGIIRYITVNNAHVAITLSNNSVVIASTQMRVMSTILECGGLSPAARAIGTSLVFHRPLGALLMGGRTGHLQIYSTTTDKVLYNIDITETNRISSHRRDLLPLETEVTCAAVSSNGHWLVTSEYRNDGMLYPEEKLKFWEYKAKRASPFKLNTCVNLSHGGCNVVSIALEPQGQFCVSAGADQKFRVWKKETNKTMNETKVFWTCTTACYYSAGIGQFLALDELNRFKIGENVVKSEVEVIPYMVRNEPGDVISKIFNSHKESSVADNLVKCSSEIGDNEMGGVAISQDASLIAAWFGAKLTLWDTHLCTLRTSLSHPALRPKGVHVQFGHQDAAHYLVCTTKKCLAVWSLLSLSLKWVVQIHPTYLTAHTFTNKMAVTTANNDVYLFSPHSSTPILQRKSILNPQTGVFKLCTFGQASKDEFRLYIMRNDSEIYCLEPEKSEQGRLEVMSRRTLPKSNFSALLAEQQSSGVRSAVPVNIEMDNMNAGHTTLMQFLEASAHMVPPVSLLCTSFLQQLSGQKENKEESAEVNDEKMDVDPASSDDEANTKNNLDAPKVAQFYTTSYEEVEEKKLNKFLKEPFLDLNTTASIFGM